MTKIDLETLKSIEKLVKIGVRYDSGEKMMLNFSKMDRVKKGWTTNNAFLLEIQPIFDSLLYLYFLTEIKK